MLSCITGNNEVIHIAAI